MNFLFPPPQLVLGNNIFRIFTLEKYEPNARAQTAAASGADAEVPVWAEVHKWSPRNLNNIGFNYGLKFLSVVVTVTLSNY